MVDLAEIQTAYYMVAATGVLIAAIFYILNLRISQRNQELTLKAQQQTLETRQAQLFMNIYQQLSSPEFQKNAFEVRKMEWKDFNDWNQKYSWRVNEDAYAKQVAGWRYMDSIGFLVKNRLVDPEKIFEIQGDSCIVYWDRFKEIIKGIRERSKNPDFQQHFEYLHNEMVKIREQRGNPISSTLEAP